MLGDLNTAISIVMTWIAIRPLTVLYVNSSSVYIHSHTDNDDDHAKMLTRQTSVTIIYLFIYLFKNYYIHCLKKRPKFETV